MNFCSCSLHGASVTLFIEIKFYLPLEVVWLQLFKQPSFLKDSKMFILFFFFETLNNGKSEH